MKPYYIFKPKNFNVAQKIYDAGKSQMNISTINNITTFNTDPSTKFIKDDYQNISNIIKYDLHIETKKNDTIRVFGMAGNLEEYILVNEEKIYYSEENDILILSANKQIFNQFSRDFTKHGILNFDNLDIDFKEIIEHRNALGVQSIWWNNLQDDLMINSVGVFGSRIESSDHYNELKASGANIKNLSILYNFHGEMHKIMISEVGGIVLYEHMDNADALPLVNDIYENLFTKNK